MMETNGPFRHIDRTTIVIENHDTKPQVLPQQEWQCDNQRHHQTNRKRKTSNVAKNAGETHHPAKQDSTND
jgi:hypothetical protein